MYERVQISIYELFLTPPTLAMRTVYSHSYTYTRTHLHTHAPTNTTCVHLQERAIQRAREETTVYKKMDKVTRLISAHAVSLLHVMEAQNRGERPNIDNLMHAMHVNAGREGQQPGSLFGDDTNVCEGGDSEASSTHTGISPCGGGSRDQTRQDRHGNRNRNSDMTKKGRANTKKKDSVMYTPAEICRELEKACVDLELLKGNVADTYSTQVVNQCAMQ